MQCAMAYHWPEKLATIVSRDRLSAAQVSPSTPRGLGGREASAPHAAQTHTVSGRSAAASQDQQSRAAGLASPRFHWLPTLGNLLLVAALACILVAQIGWSR